jgi:hypothetical protein
VEAPRRNGERGCRCWAGFRLLFYYCRPSPVELLSRREGLLALWCAAGGWSVGTIEAGSARRG